MFTGAVTTLAGFGDFPGFADGAASSALFSRPRGLAVTSKGLLLVADSGNHAIRVVDLGTLVVWTVAGSSLGSSGFLDGVGRGSSFNNPLRIVVLPDDTALVTDQGNNALRLVDFYTRAVST
ncbi:hypothetical protein T484DRAFT_1569307, partial [Baffinella frigidus]